jgi:hypothetical protein
MNDAPVAHGGTLGGSLAPDDGLLLDRVRHYLVVVIAITILGAVGGGALGVLASPRAEMWSIVVDTQQLLPARQLGVVAETLFRSEETYRAALSDLGLGWDPDELFGAVELRSVPEARFLIVVARGDDAYSAAIVSGAMARSLAAAFEEAGYPGFEILGAPQPPRVASTASLPVFVMLGATTALLLALAGCIVHNRTRRPVVTLGGAAAILGATSVASAPARWRHLGVLRRVLPVGLSTRARAIAAADLRLEDGPVDLRWPGASPGRPTRLAAALEARIDPHAPRRVVVADPCSTERALTYPLPGNPSSVTLLWLA